MKRNNRKSISTDNGMSIIGDYRIELENVKPNVISIQCVITPGHLWLFVSVKKVGYWVNIKIVIESEIVLL